MTTPDHDSPAEKIRRRTDRAVGLMLYFFLAMLIFNLAKIANLSHGQDNAKGRTYTERELDDFWESRIKKVVWDELLKNKCQFPEIKERYEYLSRKIRERYGELTLNLSAVRPVQTNAVAGTVFSNGVPYIVLFMTRFIDLYEGDLKRIYGEKRREALESLAIGAVMHEAEHLVGDLPRHSGMRPEEKVVADEIHSWAMTCEYTIGPLVDKHHRAVALSDLYFYREWVRCERNELDPRWQALIRGHYQGVEIIRGEGNIPKKAGVTN